MKTSVLFVVSALLISLRASGGEDMQVRMTLNLRDGSSVVGTPEDSKLSLKTEFGDSTVPLELLREIQMDPHAIAKFLFRNGDRLSGKFKARRVAIKSSLGDLEIAATNIVSAQFANVLPSKLSGNIQSVVGNYDGEAITVQFEMQGGHQVSTDPKGEGYWFDGDSTFVRPGDDIPRKIGTKDFSIAFDFKPARQKHETVCIIEHHRAFPWTGLFLSIENNRTLRFRTKDVPHCHVTCDVAEIIGDGPYHHAVVSRKGLVMEIHLDGRLVATANVPELVDLNIDYGGNHLTIGSHSDGQDASYAGALRNMIFFIGRCLTEKEISTLAQ